MCLLVILFQREHFMWDGGAPNVPLVRIWSTRGSLGGRITPPLEGGSNYLCLPNEPVFNYYSSDEKPSKIYGAEFEGPSPGLGLANAKADHLQDQNVPCAVCQSKRYSQLMIPARNVCYPGWTPEYSGYLMSGYPGHAGRYQFVCMDEKPETVEGGFPDENGALFYNVEGVCGSLLCPPYIPRREITCVVCSKWSVKLNLISWTRNFDTVIVVNTILNVTSTMMSSITMTSSQQWRHQWRMQWPYAQHISSVVVSCLFWRLANTDSILLQ